MAAAICFELKTNNGNVKPIITKTKSIDLESYDMDQPDTEIMSSVRAGLGFATADYIARDRKQQHGGGIQMDRRNRAHSYFGLSKVKNSIGSLITLIVGALMLEIVITVSFRSVDALFLVISTLTAGTVVYMIDGSNK